jgi:1-acyl-sn-glycerol-3-phosphate acyltransferase
MEHAHSHKQQPDPVDTYMDMVPQINKYLKFRYAEVVTEGLENIVDGSAVYVANHLRLDDSFAIAAVYANHTGRPLRLGAKKEYFDGDGFTRFHLFGKQVKKFVEDTQQLSVPRDRDSRGLVVLDKDVKRRMIIGESLLLHAEGTRSKDGRLNKFKKGAVQFATRNKVPVGPASVNYGRMPFSFRQYVKVQFGKVHTPPTYGMDFHHHLLIPNRLVDAVAPRIMNQAERIETLTDLLEEDVASMSKQQRSGYYLDPYTKTLIIPESEQ